MNRAQTILIAVLVITGACVVTSYASEGGMILRQNELHRDTSHTIFQQDKSFEKDLRELADPDKVMTPRKALRWVRELIGTGSSSTEVSNIEFRPDVKINDANVRIIAAFAYKF